MKSNFIFQEEEEVVEDLSELIDHYENNEESYDSFYFEDKTDFLELEDLNGLVHDLEDFSNE